MAEKRSKKKQKVGSSLNLPSLVEYVGDSTLFPTTGDIYACGGPSLNDVSLAQALMCEAKQLNEKLSESVVLLTEIHFLQSRLRQYQEYAERILPTNQYAVAHIRQFVRDVRLTYFDAENDPELTPRDLELTLTLTPPLDDAKLQIKNAILADNGLSFGPDIAQRLSEFVATPQYALVWQVDDFFLRRNESCPFTTSYAGCLEKARIECYPFIPEDIWMQLLDYTFNMYMPNCSDELRGFIGVKFKKRFSVDLLRQS